MFRYIFAIILIGASLTGFFLVVNPLYKEVSLKREKVSDYNEALDNSKALEKIKDGLTQKSNSFSPVDVDKLQKLLPDHVDNIRLILEIEKIALPYGMVLKEVKYETGSTNTESPTEDEVVVEELQYENELSLGDYNTINLEFSTQGTYDKFINFIKDLENNLRIVDIFSIQFATDSSLSVNPKLQEAYKFSFKIKTYWLKK